MATAVALRRAGKVVGYVAIAIVGLLVIVLVILLVVTNTDWGREIVRREIGQLLNDRFEGRFSIGGIDGNLLTGATLTDVRIGDTQGAPFLLADSVRVNYSVRGLLSQRILLDNLRLVDATIVLDQRPGERWNWEKIFIPDTTETPEADTAPGFGSWIRIEEASVVDSRVIVRLPWEPDSALAGAARDSAIAAALGPMDRAAVVRVPNGFQTIYEFRELSAQLPLLRVADPDYEEQLYRIASLQTVALPFDPPAARVLDLSGTVYVTGDSLWFQAARVALPGTRAELTGVVTLGDTTDIRLAVRADTVALQALQWLYPPLPNEGGGRLALTLALGENASRYVARDVRLTIGDADLAGDLGITLAGDTLAFLPNTRFAFEEVPVSLIEQLAPALDIPREGTLTGRAQLTGPLTRLAVDAAVAFDGAATGVSRVTAVGQLGITDEGFRADQLRLQLEPLQGDLASAYLPPDVAIPGVLTGSLTLNGSTADRLSARFDLTQQAPGTRSRLAGTGAVRLEPSLAVSLDARALPLDLGFVGRTFAPDLGLRGQLRGPVRVNGPLRDLEIFADLAVVGADGTLQLAARADLEEPGRRYAAELTTRSLNVSNLYASAPTTNLTLQAELVGEGLEPATLDARLALRVQPSRVDTAFVDSALVRAAASDGLLLVDTAAVYSSAARLTAEGTLGLVRGRDGTLTYRLFVDSLAAFGGYVPTDTTVTQLRPAVRAELLAQLRADSAQRLRQFGGAETFGAGAVPAAADSAPILPTVAGPRADSLSGALYAAGVVAGNIYELASQGRVGVLDLVAAGSTVDEARLEYEWADILADSGRLEARLRADQVLAAGFRFDSLTTALQLRGGVGDGEGLARVQVWQDRRRDLAAVAGFDLAAGARRVRLEELALRFDSTTWRSVTPAEIALLDRGVQIDTLLLRDGDGGIIFANGLLPTSGEGRLELLVRELPVENVSALLQEEPLVEGRLFVEGVLAGAATSPTLRGAFGLADGEYAGVELPQLRGTFRYDQQRLETSLLGLRLFDEPTSDPVVLRAEATLPVNLAVTTDQPRLPEGPLTARVELDNLTLDPLAAFFPDVFADVRGVASGLLTVDGTLDSPELNGTLAIEDAGAQLVPLGVPFSRLAAAVRIANDTIVIDSLVGYADGGRVFVRGGIGIDSLPAPAFDLFLIADDAHAIDNELASLYVDAALRMRGPYESAYVSGTVRIREGVIYIPDPGTGVVLAPDDPTLFLVADDRVIEEGEVIAPPSPLLENLRASINLLVSRGTFVRSPEANVEIYTPDEVGPLIIRLDQGADEFVLEGSVATERGEYTFIGKRFAVEQGSVVFIGTPELNPTLQITGQYVVQLPSREALNIRIVIGGTLESPRITLESDAQPPLSQSDLISYLALGRSASTLLSQQASSIRSGSSAGQAGQASGVLSDQIAPLALNVLFNELVISNLEQSAGRRLGADVFNITPADAPAELFQGGGSRINRFVVGTEFEIGRYLTPDQFLLLTVRPSLLFPPSGTESTQPGIRYEWRINPSLTLLGTFESRYLLNQPTLGGGTDFTPRGVLGFFLTKEWRW